ncbi:MAG: hypothetical protein HZB67_01145 [Candidatus Aenigmarchaeota archaeon]|nr:hypothetical protein [Candidatus Aenigmarchaeota archaeon]
MVIGTTELLRLVKERKLVEGLSRRELENPEGTGFDLRVGSMYSLHDGDAYLGEAERYTAGVEELARYEPGKKRVFELQPGQFILVKTIEKINLPEDIVAIFRPRSTLCRSGISLHTATANPGYCGCLTFGMNNTSKNPLKIELGARFVHILFFHIDGGIHSAYRGQWQGGRVSTGGVKEEQV